MRFASEPFGVGYLHCTDNPTPVLCSLALFRGSREPLTFGYLESNWFDSNVMPKGIACANLLAGATRALPLFVRAAL